MKAIFWILCGSCVVVIAAPALAVVTPSPHRKVEGDVGNCIFSDRPMPFGKDAEFAPQKTFRTGDDVYARCYYAKPLREYEGEGRRGSSLRGLPVRKGGVPQKYVSARLQFDEPMRSYVRQSRYDKPDREQAYFYLFDGPECDFKMGKFGRAQECVSLDREVRALAKARRLRLPFTTTICLYREFDVIDDLRRNERLEWEDVRAMRIVAKGCFDYTARNR